MNSVAIYTTDSGIVWIPDDASVLQLRLMIVAHCGTAGHRGLVATYEALSSRFFWMSIRSDLREFLKQCLHCLSNRAGDTIPRPFGASIEPQFRNHVIDFDYL